MPIVINLSNIQPIYREAVDELINKLGKNFTLYYKNTVTNVNNENYDHVYGTPNKKPLYKAATPTIVYNTEVIKGLTQWNPKKFIVPLDTKINEPDTIVEIKTFIENIDKLKRAEYIVPNSDSLKKIGYSFRLIREPVPQGLGDDFYCISYWQRVVK